MSAAAQSQPASDRVQASAHFDRALEFVQHEDYEAAAREFEQAFRLSQDAAVLYNLGMAYVAAGRPIDAASALERYLKAGGATLPPGERTRIEAELQAQRSRIGYLVLELEPRCALVKVDDREMSPVAVSSPIPLLIGEHHVEVSHPQYLATSRVLTVAAEKRAQVRVALVPVADMDPAHLAQIPIRCSVPDVAVFIDGQAATVRAGQGSQILVSPGSHKISFHRDGYDDSSSLRVFSAGVAAPVECDLHVLPKLPVEVAATLRVDVEGPKGELRVDGGAWPAQGRLPAGRHRVEASGPDVEPWSEDVVLRAGETTSLDVVLKPRRDLEAVRVRSGNNMRIIAYVALGTGTALGVAALVTATIGSGKYASWKDEDAAIKQETKSAQLPLDHATEQSIEHRKTINDQHLKAIWQMDVLTWALAIGGGVLGAGGGFLLWKGHDTEAPASTQLALHGNGIELKTRF